MGRDIYNELWAQWEQREGPVCSPSSETLEAHDRGGEGEGLEL